MKSIWRLLSPLYRQRIGGLALALFLAIITLAAGVSLLGVSGWFLTGAALVASWETFNLFAPSALVRGFSFIRIVSRYAERLVGHEATLRLLADLRAAVFKRLLPLDAAQLARYRDGDLVARLTGDVDALDTVYLFAIAPVVTGLVIGVILSCVIGAWLPAAGLVLLLCLLLSTLLVPFYLARQARQPGVMVQEAVGEMRDHIMQTVVAHADLRALGVQEKARREFAEQCLRVALARRRQVLLAANGKAEVQILSGVSVVAILYWGSESLARGEINGPVWAGLLLASLGLFEVMGPIMRGASRLGSAAAAAERIEALSQMQASIVDPTSPVELPTTGELVLSEVRYAYPNGRHEVNEEKGREVRYAYPNGLNQEERHLGESQLGALQAGAHRGVTIKETGLNHGSREVLKGINLRVRAGERIAIVGRSGAGKTSLLNLLMRLDDPTAGAIYYAGVNLRDARLAQVHQRMALLAQDAPVFLGTIRSNLLIGSAQADETMLWQALENARLAEFVRSLPEGLDTWTGETGRTLSAGQARRLCLARALLSPAQVLVLDEPTRGLDRETEQEFLEDLMAATQGRTVIMVSHAALPSGAVERVYRLEGGQLVLEGRSRDEIR
ncbi:MAG: ATP-binding cassette domain-containing protein [Pelistega sp.]|nr:ATP-binding cassette domain-containing protein [Pelistega sp.]